MKRWFVQVPTVDTEQEAEELARHIWRELDRRGRKDEYELVEVIGRGGVSIVLPKNALQDDPEPQWFGFGEGDSGWGLDV